jgi:hypothetical protein
MSTMTASAAPAGEWTLVYTSEADGSDIGVANNSHTVPLRVRIGSDATTGDAETAGHATVQPNDMRSFSDLADGDEVYVRPVGPDAGRVTVWA